MTTESMANDRARECQKQAFDKWFGEPMVRLGLSLIPPGDHKDALRLLLQSAFDAGYEQGGGQAVVSLMQAMTKKPQPENR
jgi:hypothetical protein